MKKWIVLLSAVSLMVCAFPLTAQAEVWLEPGMTSDEVYDAQYRLWSLGYYPYEPDGYYGSVTADAVASFQASYGLYTDGIVGDYTMEALGSMTGGYTAPAEVSAPSAPAASSDLSIGMSGNEVADMQAMLVQFGYMENIVDGVFGSVTEAAVKRFQEANGLYMDGVVGPYTMDALRNYTASAAPAAAQPQAQEQTQAQPVIADLYEGMTGDAVRALQSQLADLGYPVYVDGVFGAQTAEIVRDFQSRNGLYVDGVVGSYTAGKLKDSPVRYSAATTPAATPSAVYDGVTLTEDIAEYMKNLVNSVTDSSMTKEEKLWATFNYIADRGNYPYLQNRIPYYRGEDWPVVYAHDMMYLGGSYCHGYASLFGYAATLSGYSDVHWAQNGYHAWVDVDGLVYDPVFRDSSYNTLVYGWTYEQAIANNGNLGAGFDYPGGEGTYQFIKAPQF